MLLFPKFQGAATPLFSAKGWSYGVAATPTFAQHRSRISFLGLCKTINPKNPENRNPKPYTDPENLKSWILKPKAIIPMYSQCFRSSSGDKYMILFDIVCTCYLDVGKRGGWCQHVQNLRARAFPAFFHTGDALPKSSAIDWDSTGVPTLIPVQCWSVDCWTIYAENTWVQCHNIWIKLPGTNTSHRWNTIPACQKARQHISCISCISLEWGTQEV